MNNMELMNYWIESADEDYDTMLYMKAGKKIRGVYLWDI